MWRFAGTFDGDVGETVFGQQRGEVAVHFSPQSVHVDTFDRPKPHAQTGRRGLHHLEQLDTPHPLHQRRHRQGRQGDRFTGAGGEREQVGGTALNPDGRQDCRIRSDPGA